jgi:hypothetical protein
MKYTLFVITVFFSVPNISAQDLSLDDLLIAIDYNTDDLDTYLVKKGFTYSPGRDSKDSSNQKNCKYLFEYSHKQNSKYRIATYSCIYNNYAKELAYRFPEDSKYVAFKESLRNKEFVFDKSLDHEGTLYSFFQKIKDGVKIEIVVSAKKSLASGTLYEIAILKTSNI